MRICANFCLASWMNCSLISQMTHVSRFSLGDHQVQSKSQAPKKHANTSTHHPPHPLNEMTSSNPYSPPLSFSNLCYSRVNHTRTTSTTSQPRVSTTTAAVVPPVQDAQFEDKELEEIRRYEDFTTIGTSPPPSDGG
jgi:hypothetical protein